MNRIVPINQVPMNFDETGSLLVGKKSHVRTAESAVINITAVFKNVSHSLKFRFSQLPDGLDTSPAVQLEPGQYGDYLQFFQTQHPDASPEGWLKDYYASLTDRGYTYGVYDGRRLVCATDAPDIPYMSDVIVEPGINTLAPYRRQGYAKAAVVAMLEHLLAIGKTPIWSCRATNRASAALAMGVGFVEFADVFTVSADRSDGPS